MGLDFNYELNNHSNTHTDFQIKCRYLRCGRVYKSESEYKRHYKLHPTEYHEYTCATCGKKCSEKKIYMSTCRYTPPLYVLLAPPVDKNFDGAPVSQNMSIVNMPQPFPHLQIVKTNLKVQNSNFFSIF